MLGFGRARRVELEETKVQEGRGLTVERDPVASR
jgi:hypothetical protein